MFRRINYELYSYQKEAKDFDSQIMPVNIYTNPWFLCCGRFENGRFSQPRQERPTSCFQTELNITAFRLSYYMRGEVL